MPQNIFGFIPQRQIPSISKQEEKDILDNMNQAIIYTPELFNEYEEMPMLYVNGTVNGCRIQAYVDCGAQRTCMSMKCAKRCGVSHLIDTSCSGDFLTASGIQKNVGRVHFFPIKTARNKLLTSFEIMDHMEDDIIFGLDLLKRYNCTIDLKNHKLLIGLTKSEVSFLEEAEITTQRHIKFFSHFRSFMRRITGDHRMRRLDANIEAAMLSGLDKEVEKVTDVLYINCQVNGQQLKAMIDSGAQRTTMSAKCAEKCRIRKLADPREAYELTCGMGKIIKTEGTVHYCAVNIEKDEIFTRFDILDDLPVDVLLGLDVLKRYECRIDVKGNNLIIGKTGTTVDFLPIKAENAS